MIGVQFTDQKPIIDDVIKIENGIINQLLLPRRHTFKVLSSL